MHLTGQDPRRRASGPIRASSRAAPAACSTISPRRRISCDGRARSATAISTLNVYPASPCPINLELTKNGATADAARGRRASSSRSFCGPCFGAGDVPGQQRPLHPPYDAQLPEPRGLQARRGPVRRRVPDGRPLHRRHGGQRRPHHRRPDDDWTMTPRPPRSTTLTRRVYRRAAFTTASARPSPRRGADRLGPNITDWPKMYGPGGKPAAGAGRRHPRPGHHHRRADPLRRDVVLPLEPAAAGGVHPLPPRCRTMWPCARPIAALEAERSARQASGALQTPC